MEKEILDAIIELSKIDQYKFACHQHVRNERMPSINNLQEIVQLCRSVLFPGYFDDAALDSDTLLYHIGLSIDRLKLLLTEQLKAGFCFEREHSTDKNLCSDMEQNVVQKVNAFIAQLPEIRRKLYTDVIAAYNGDPAAKSIGEVIFCYPGIRAISNYRIAHALLILDVPLIPRIISELAHSETGIDIHPGAEIGDYFMIDHGTGVVIGETSVIGNNVKMYQGVTLGARSFPLDENGNPIKGIVRHPRIGNNVIIYSNSTILGNITVGDGAVIGGNLWVDSDVPAGAKLSQDDKLKR
ncbi:MAG TPA: serine acetyltransferase [Paludibacteraceae bacterium]|nr:serine acetyltransferase [Paludibacteraceae bacterium]HOL29247.1 serine acetyltransferase [Paludibacteraceae bacterium]HON02791.1 serine acetyltransferase [Paludibacteraceae bacterium]HPD59617.1 serine acetyltransferase [Paludibacteraceae bacterium]HPQ13443.1 serine acetyltransferase [Paludibacteraceae bacterium]